MKRKNPRSSEKKQQWQHCLAPGWFRGFSKKTPKRTWFAR